jgi:hypothetical protein
MNGRWGGAGCCLWEPGVTLHFYVTVHSSSSLPHGQPTFYFVKTIHHRQTNSSIVKEMLQQTVRTTAAGKKKQKSFRLNCKRQNRTTTTTRVCGTLPLDSLEWWKVGDE